MNLLEDIIIVDFSQFLSGPSAALRLADMGAQVIKIERPGNGDICRQLYVSDVMIEGESTIFHAINRNKQSYAADLKDADDLEKVKQLLAKADVMMHNFRPGVMERIGLDYVTVKQINPSIIYAEISGYGNEGPWKDLPGQDLLLQAASGLTWLSNNNDESPTPMGVAVVDIMAGTHIAQGILATLYRRAVNGEGALVQVNMFESILDFQFEVLTSYYNDGKQLPVRGAINSAHAYIAAPYGIYKTSEGYVALAMGDIVLLASLLQCEGLKQFSDSNDWFNKRDEIKKVLADHLLTNTSLFWLTVLEKADIWCAPVMNYDTLVQQDAYKLLNMEITVKTSNGLAITTTRCPIRVDGKLLVSDKGAPQLGEHNAAIEKQFELEKIFLKNDQAHIVALTMQRIIDTHIHVWDLQRAEYPWLQNGDSILNQTWRIEQLNRERESTGVGNGILVQASGNIEDTELMMETARQTSWINGVVAWLPLMNSDAAAALLEKKYLKEKYFKGVRHQIHDEPNPKWLLQPAVIDSLKIVSEKNVPYDVVAVLPQHIETALEVAEKVPALKMVFDHLSQPPIKGKEKFGVWGELMKVASQHKNFYAKISGLGTASGDWEHWSAEEVKPYIAFALEHFGTDRCFCGGDWPVSQLAGTYTKVWEVYTTVVNSLVNEKESDNIFYNNARQFYNL